MDSVKSDFRQSILRKVEESNQTSRVFFEENSQRLSLLAAAMAAAFSCGKKLWVMGNGGSACDAEHMATEFAHPIFEKRKPLPAIALSASNALVTAIANDVDFSMTFARQLELHAAAGDMALAISSSGMSANLVQGLQAARKMGLMTIGFGGKDGGRVKDLVDWSFVVPSYSIHRIQETHVTLLHVLWDLVHLHLGENDIV